MNILELFAGLWMTQTAMYQEVLQVAHSNSCVIEDIPPIIWWFTENCAIEQSSRQSTKSCTTEESDSLSAVCLIKYCV